MKKQVKRVNVNFNFDWCYGAEIKKLREDLDQLEKLGATEIEIETEEEWGVASVSIKAFFTRIETDEEFNSRIEKEKKNQKHIIDCELALLNRLKNKYGL